MIRLRFIAKGFFQNARLPALSIALIGATDLVLAHLRPLWADFTILITQAILIVLISTYFTARVREKTSEVNELKELSETTRRSLETAEAGILELLRLRESDEDFRRQELSSALDLQRRGPGNYVLQRVFFVTDRLSVANKAIPSFGADRALLEKLSYGVYGVSIPRTHELGHVEGPSIWRLEFRARPDRHVTVLEGEVFDGSAAFFEAITRAVPDPNNYSVLLFVHGYNTAFEDAVRRTAQLTYDLDYPGVAITYSWPSLGSSIAYARDESNVDWTTPHLQKFLTAVAVRQGVRTINIIAHSLGNRAVAKALHNMVLSGEDVRFTNVVLAAPDVDRDIFIQLAPAIAQGAETVTLYASDHDRALNASKQINGYPRAGDCGNDIVVHPGIQTVDVSALDTDFMGHGYVAENTSVVSDLYWVLKGQPPPRFRLRPAISPSGPYWRFVP